MTGRGGARIPGPRVSAERLPSRWQDDAACQDYPSAWWFPDEDTGRLSRDNDKAIAICGMCAVRAECAEFARDETYGIWGGQAHGPRGLRRTDATRVREALRALPEHVSVIALAADLAERGVDVSERQLNRLASGETARVQVSVEAEIVAACRRARLVPMPVLVRDVYRNKRRGRGSDGTR